MHISEINIYPIKSLGGISVKTATVEQRGLRYDRRWMLVDAAGRSMTQREFPRMATIDVSVKADGLLVTADGITALKVPFDPSASREMDVTIWDSVCGGQVFPDGVNAWFSQVLGVDCLLVYMPEGSRRSVSERFDKGGDIVSFADGYPLLVIGEASLADLNSRLGQPLAMNRFRPNIVVAGSEAFDEDGWEKIRVGDAVFRVTKPCARCVMTTIDQSAGVAEGPEPLRTLASYRMAKMVIPDRLAAYGMSETAVLFGQNLIAETWDIPIAVGDEVEVVG